MLYCIKCNVYTNIVLPLTLSNGCDGVSIFMLSPYCTHVRMVYLKLFLGGDNLQRNLISETDSGVSSGALNNQGIDCSVTCDRNIRNLLVKLSQI
jgi:hypothetical protein